MSIISSLASIITKGRKIRFKQGLEANLPSDLDIGEPAFTTDKKNVYIGSDSGNVKMLTEADAFSVDDIPLATPTKDGLMPKDDKLKLNGISSGANHTTVIDNLTSTSTTSAASANQVRVLKDLIDNIDTSGDGGTEGGNTANIYGVKIDTTNSNPETALTYADNATGFTPALGNNGVFNYGSWEDKFPFNQIKPCVLKDGVVNYYLNPNDYTKKLDGTTADITSGNDGDVMVEFPKVYWKFETIGTDLYVRYSDRQVDEGYKCLSHMRATDEKDKVYISAYLGFELSGKLRSLSGKTVTNTKTIEQFRTLSKENGSNYEQMAYYQLLMLQVLYIVMFKNRDSQTALGRGYLDGNTTSIATGGTNKKGLFYGEATGKQQMKFCGIEDFYGNVYYWIDGLFSDANRNILIGNQNFNDTGSGYTNFGQGATVNLTGLISDIQGGTETGFSIKASGGSETTYYADYGNLYASCLPIFGGSWVAASGAGAFRLDMTYSASNAHSHVAARLICN